MILAEDTTNPTFYAYFRGFMALFLGFGFKSVCLQVCRCTSQVDQDIKAVCAEYLYL